MLRPTRRPLPPAVGALALVSLLLTLAACGSAGGASADPSPTSSTTATSTDSSTPTPSGSSAVSSTQLPQVQGAFGTEPTVAMPGGSAPSQLVTKVLSKGTGTTVAKGDLLVADYVGMLWSSGKTFDSSWQGGRQPAGFAIGMGQVIPGWDKALVGQTVGSRVLLVIPPADGYGSSGNPQAGIAGDDTLVFVVDVLGAVDATASAKGTPTPTEDDALPAVSVLPRKPDITIPPGRPPGRLIALPVVTGNGPVVRKGDVIAVQYVGEIWRTGKQFDSSWDRGGPAAVPIGVGQIIPGWDKGLVGKKVGSRVLLVIPPAEGYGSSGNSQAGITGTDTLVFAVDILAAIRRGS